MAREHRERQTPGIAESAAWISLLGVSQLIGAIAVAAICVTTRFGVPRSMLDVGNAIDMLQCKPYPAVLVGCGALLPSLVLIPAIVLRLGATWREEMHVRPCSGHLLILALGATIPLAVVAAACRFGAIQLMEQLGLADVLPFTKVSADLGDQLGDLPFAVLVSVMALGPAVIEEFVFRGFIGRSMIGRWGVVGGVLVTTALFAGSHLSPAYAIGVIPIGLFLHVVYLATRSLHAAILVHFANNLLAAAAARFHVLDQVDVTMPLVCISIGVVLAISGVLWQTREENQQVTQFSIPSQVVAGTAVAGFTLLFVSSTV